MPDGPVPEGSAPDEEAVRALLRSMRDPEPTVPPEVAARLEARLADLADDADHADPVHTEGTVVSMPPRAAGGRAARGILVAAAVAAVVGLGAVQVLDPLGGGSDSAETADSTVSADPPSAARPESGPANDDGAITDDDGSQARSAEDFAAEESGPQSLDSSPDAASLPSLTTRSFALEVAALPPEPADAPRPPDSCTPGGLGPDTEVRTVLLDGRPGVLALYPAGTEGADARSRVAEAWRCGDLVGPAGTAAPPRVRVIVAAR